MSKLKICGLKTKADVEIINETQPDYCGFIVDYPKSRRSLESNEACRLAANVLETVKKVAVFVDEPMEKVIKTMANFDMAQLHGKESESYIEELKRKTSKPVIKAVIPKNATDVEYFCKTKADYLLFDAGKGEGRAFDWEILKNVRSSRKYFLAGGLNEENIGSALDALDPYAIDISSGVESDGKKDYAKIKRITEFLKNNQERGNNDDGF